MRPARWMVALVHPVQRRVFLESRRCNHFLPHSIRNGDFLRRSATPGCDKVPRHRSVAPILPIVRLPLDYRKTRIQINILTCYIARDRRRLRPASRARPYAAGGEHHAPASREPAGTHGGIRLRQPWQGGSLALDQHLAKIPVAAFRDAQKLLPSLGDGLPKHEPPPCAEVAPLAEAGLSRSGLFSGTRICRSGDNGMGRLRERSANGLPCGG